jgi:hypothetical protein
MSAKIFARNLTARAAQVVDGNPVSSRPESGVDNSHPGWEFDPRNLDRCFFPGLVVDFSFRFGARVSRVSGRPQAEGLTQQHLDTGKVFLWSVEGCFGGDPGTVQRCETLGLDGYQVLAKVKDLEPGWLVVIVGPAEGGQAAAADLAAARAQAAQLPKGQPGAHVERRGDALAWAVFADRRARYLDEDGVIDTEVMEPGFLTQSLCSPWQWDFADCGCYYWAASRPDIVLDEGNPPQPANYQRDPRLAPAPVERWNRYDYDEGWMKGTISQQQMILRWEELPLVIDDQERRSGQVDPGLPKVEPVQPLDFAQGLRALAHLAAVAHTRCVQYLYAQYSVNHPARADLPVADAGQQQALETAARTLKELSIDEMRHMARLCELQRELGQAANLARAAALELDVDSGGTAGAVPDLLPATDAALDALAASQTRQNGRLPMDLYLRLSAGVPGWSEVSADQRQRLAEVCKLLIDEARHHGLRLDGVKAGLAQVPAALRLRVQQGPQPAGAGDPQEALQENGGKAYGEMLGKFAQEYARPAGQGRVPGAGMRPMMGMGAAAEALASQGIGLRFVPIDPA